VKIHLVTEASRLRDFVDEWEALADATSSPRSGGGFVTAWAEHMMDPDTELRVWIATEGQRVLGVLPFVAEPMPRGRVRLVAPSTNLMYGTVPIAHPERAAEVVQALVDEFVQQTDLVNIATLEWLPEGSPWTATFRDRLDGPEWVVAATRNYVSSATTIGNGVQAWLNERSTEFRRTVRRRARRYEEEGFRRITTEDPVEIVRRLPRLREFYVSTQQKWAQGEGYRFDDSMIRTLETAIAYCPRGRVALSVVERDDLLIGAQLALRAGRTMSCWIIGHDAAWSRFGPGIAALVEAFDAGARCGITLADFGGGDEPYKNDLHGGDSAVPMQSVTWCRPRLARMLSLESPSPSSATSRADT
jgi:CelD/BcsL family acetyltransferase involved in cellulose biosynthesis